MNLGWDVGKADTLRARRHGSGRVVYSKSRRQAKGGQSGTLTPWLHMYRHS